MHLPAHVITMVTSAAVAGDFSLRGDQPATTREQRVYTSFESQSLAPKYPGNNEDLGGVRGLDLDVHGLRDFLGDGVEFLFNGLHLGVAIGNFTGADKLAISLLELLGKRLRQRVRAVPGRNLLDKLVGQVIGQCKGLLSCCHRQMLPYFRIDGLGES
jgi:hypothetical protein